MIFITVFFGADTNISHNISRCNYIIFRHYLFILVQVLWQRFNLIWVHMKTPSINGGYKMLIILLTPLSQ